jgi:PAS domain S-box-containing protein
MKQLAWLPIPVFLVAILGLWTADLRTSYESLSLMTGLNVLFSLLTSLFVLYLICRSFLANGKPGLLMIGCGVLFWSAAASVGIAAGFMKGAGSFDINILITVHNVCTWLSALCHMTGTVISQQSKRTLHSPSVWLAVGSSVSLGVIALVAHSSLVGLMPIFFVQGQGGTLVRTFVLSSAIIMFTLSVILLWVTNRRDPSSFAFWYTLALALIAVGLLGILIEAVHGSLLSWSGRAGQFLGGAYMLIAAFACVRESGAPEIFPGQVPSETRHRYLVAVAIVVASVVVRLLFLQGLEIQSPFLTFYPAVMLSALYGGLRSGLLATVLSALMADYFWIEPTGRFSIGHQTDWLVVAVFLLSCFLISWISEALHRAQVRAREAETQTRIATERERAAEALRESEERYHALFNNMTEGFALHEMIYDTHGAPCDYRFLDINPAFEHLTGLKREDLIGRTCRQVLSHTESVWITTYGRVTLTGEPAHFERYSAELGRHYEVFAYRHAPGQFAVIFMDISERKRSEDEIRRTRDELEERVTERTKELSQTVETLLKEITERRRLEQQLLQSQKMESIGRLAGGVAHDFNNLLSGIHGYGEIIQENIAPDDEVLQESIGQVLKASMRAAELTRSLLTFSRKQIIIPKPVLMSDIISNTSKFIQRVIGEDIEFCTEFHGEELLIMGDTGQMEQVLMNLATNARDAMPGGGRLSIATRRIVVAEGTEMLYDLPSSGKYVLTSVTDTGTGIDNDSMEKLFEPFYTTKEVGKGTGLGLSIIYGIIKQHNGSVLVSSEPGTGTTVNIYLPLISGHAAGEEEDASAQHCGGPETLLVAEDEEIVRSFMKKAFENVGYRVLSASDGEEAVALFREHKDISLVLSDVIMPGKNGKEMLEEMRSINPDIKVIFISGYPSDILNKKGISEKGVVFITKPVKTHDLVRTVREVLDRT